MQYDCPSVLMCSINCASEGSIDRGNVLIMPFNNYGNYYLRMRFCPYKTHPERLSRYSTVDQVPCRSLNDFLICASWIPPMTFVPVAFIKNTTYMEIDSCTINKLGQQTCLTNPKPSRIYGNSYMFPSTFDVAQTKFSICASDADCLGSFCDLKFHPPVCSPKALIHVDNSGKHYFSDPYS